MMGTRWRQEDITTTKTKKQEKQEKEQQEATSQQKKTSTTLVSLWLCQGCWVVGLLGWWVVCVGLCECMPWNWLIINKNY